MHWRAEGLPSGVSVDNNGFISGSVTTFGSFDFHVTLLGDSNRVLAQRDLRLVAPLRIFVELPSTQLTTEDCCSA